ncbi:hypothetical protein [Chelativorans sp.]|uniref:hypothetical protein n=1 Tax=Chelativorans sp. TaxID=2203393 RepID=UPI0028125B54|nr:hypothetical protein [Chelativorans sp.]
MSVRTLSISVAAATLVIFAGAAPVQALTMQECSAKYQAAKSSGALNGMKWNDFRKTECSSDASAANSGTSSGSAPAAETANAGASTGSALNSLLGDLGLSGGNTGSPSGNAIFPSAVSQRYSNESAGKARMHTCLDQYRANKANGGNGGLNWIQKGGGYYSECSKRLGGG